MGNRDYYTQPQPSRRPLLGATNNALILLIAINAFLFIILKFLLIVYEVSYTTTAFGGDLFFKQVLNWFILPAQADKLFTRPWTLLTYMFTNINAVMLLSNLLWLWSFGYILQDMAGNKKLIPVYLYGGLVGGISFLLSVLLVPSFSHNATEYTALVGSGTAVVAVAVATTTFAPEYRIFPLINGGIPLWILTVIFVAIDFASMGNGAVAVAHLAAAAIGFVFVKQLGKGNDMGAWMNNFAMWFNDLFNPDKQKKQHAQKDKHFYKTAKKPYQKTANITQQKLDDILDKINQYGYAMLNEEEKEFLKRASKEEL